MNHRPTFHRCWILFIALGFSLSSIGRASPGIAAGEIFVYRVGWGIFGGAGEITITGDALPAVDGRLRLKVSTTTATRGLAKALLTFEARAESIFDVHTGRMLATSETSKTQQKETNTTMTFDYEKSVATFTNVKAAAPPVPMKMPPGEPLDLIMSLVQSREWNLKPGEKRDALVIFGDDFYELTLYAERYEEVRTPLGTFNTVVIVPRMEKTPPKGMFRRGSTVRVWISQDERRLPVKFQVEFKFGAGVATLTKHQPPIGATPRTATAGGVSSSAEEKKPADSNAKNSRP